MYQRGGMVSQVQEIGTDCPTCGQPIPVVAEFHFDEEARLMIVNSKAYHLRPKCALLFALLYRRVGQTITKDAMLDALYEHSADEPDSAINALSVYLTYVRQALKDSPYVIENIYDQGWRLVRKQSPDGPAA